MLSLVVYVLINAVKYARARRWGAVLTIALAWLAGFLASWLFSATRWAGEVKIGDGDTRLDGLNVPEMIVVGLVIAAGAGVIDKFIVSRDRTQTAAVPSLSEPVPGTLPARSMGSTPAPDLSGFTFNPPEQ